MSGERLEGALIEPQTRPLARAPTPDAGRSSQPVHRHRGRPSRATAAERVMGVMIDTSVLIAGECGTMRMAALLDTLGNEPVAMAAITASELLHGYHRARDPGIRVRRGAFVEALIDAIPVLPFGLPEARRHAELWAELTRTGAIIGAHDFLIGATALAQGYALATLNRREFEQVSGLRLIALEPFIT